MTRPSYFVFFIYCLVSFAIMSSHEMWRDEYHSWQIAKSSISFFDLFENRKLEGHPYLWYSILYIIKNLGFTVTSIKYVNLFFAISATFFVLKYSKFSLFVKILYIFSYLSIYEFPVFARNYSIGIFFLFGFNSLFERRNNIKYFLILQIMLLLGSLSNICIFFISISLFVTLLYSTEKKLYNQSKYLYAISILVSILMYLSIFGDLFFPQILMRIERYGGFTDLINILKNRYFNIYYSSIILFSTLFFITIVFVFLKKINLRNIYFYSFSFSSLLILAFFTIIYPGSFRHFGHIYISLFSFLWISNKKLFFSLGEKWLNRYLLILVLGVQIPFTYKSVLNDFKRPYSHIQNAAKYIKNNNLGGRVLIGNPVFVIEGLAAELDHPKFYSFDYSFGFNFVSWKYPYLNKKFDLNLVKQICKKEEKNAVILLKEKISDSEKKNIGSKLKLIKQYSGAISDENFFLYSFDNSK